VAQKSQKSSNVICVACAEFLLSVCVCECVQGGNIMQKQQQQQKGYQKQQAALI